MIIYMNKIPKFKYRHWVSISNMFLPKLYGVNIVYDRTGKAPEVMPVYIPFLRVEHQNGWLLLEIPMWRENPWVILMFKQWPFFYVSRGGAIQLDIRTTEDE